MTALKPLSTSVASLMAVYLIAGAAGGQQPMPEYEAECQQFAADPHDPQKAGGYEGVPEGMLDIVSAYRYCEAALRSTPAPSLQLQYQFARAAFFAGDIRMAQHVVSQIDIASYPAATGLILRIGMKSPRWAHTRETVITEMREAGRRGGYPAVDYHAGLAFEVLGHMAFTPQKSAEMFEKAMKAYELASRAGVARAIFKQAKMQLLHWNAVGKASVNETLAATMERAREAGSPAATFYQAVQTASKAGAGDAQALQASLNAWRAAFEAGVPEALTVALMKDGVFTEGLVGVNERDVSERRQYLAQKAWFLGSASKDPVLMDWLAVADKTGWDDWGVSRQAVLEKAFFTGFTPAGSILLDEFHTDPASDLRRGVLLGASLRTEARPYAWMLSAAEDTFLKPEKISEADLGLAAEIYRRMLASGEKRAPLDGAVMLAKAGHTEQSVAWLEGYISAIQEPNPDRNEKANAGDRRVYVRNMMSQFHRYGLQVPAAAHRTGLAADGENYISAVFEFISGKINNEPDLEKLRAWQKQSVAIAALDDRANEQYKRWVESRLASRIDYAEMRTKPKCEDYELDYGGYDISASSQSFYVTRYGSGQRDGGYRYLYKQDEDKLTESFFLWLKASKKDDGPTGFRSKETWMRTQGSNVNVTFTGGLLGLGWTIMLDDAGDIRARDRALRGGTTDLQYRLKDGTQHSLIYNFNGFRQAYEHARDKHREIKSMADKRRCRTF